MRRAWLGVLALAAVSLVVAGWVSRSSSPHVPGAVHAGCPPVFTGYDTRVALMDEVVAVARSIALDHIVENNQGRLTRRTRRNYPVLQVVELASAPVLAGQTRLRQIATRRCGPDAARASWAVVFTDTESPVCCIKDVRFVIRIDRGWWVF
jgi:hypothetical protein